MQSNYSIVSFIIKCTNHYCNIYVILPMRFGWESNSQTPSQELVTMHNRLWLVGQIFIALLILMRIVIQIVRLFLLDCIILLSWQTWLSIWEAQWSMTTYPGWSVFEHIQWEITTSLPSGAGLWKYFSCIQCLTYGLGKK